MEEKYSIHVPLKFWFNTDIKFTYIPPIYIEPRYVKIRNLDFAWKEYLRTYTIGQIKN